MQRSKEFQFLIGNHLHNSLLAAIEENNNIDISIVKNNRIITAISKSKANDLAKAIIALNDNYGDKVVGVILHGSYAVNKAREDSDVDVFVLVKEKCNKVISGSLKLSWQIASIFTLAQLTTFGMSIIPYIKTLCEKDFYCGYPNKL